MTKEEKNFGDRVFAIVFIILIGAWIYGIYHTVHQEKINKANIAILRNNILHKANNIPFIEIYSLIDGKCSSYSTTRELECLEKLEYSIKQKEKPCRHCLPNNEK